MTKGKLNRHGRKTSTKDDNGRSTSARGRKKVVLAAEMRETKPSFFSEMPLDVLHLILGLLGPRELLSLTRTNRGFRQTLLADNARPIWKSARMHWPGGSPDCPPDISEARWADLLFGDAKCDMQGCKSGDVPVNFTLRRRACKACMKEHLVSERTYRRVYPKYKKSILYLIPSGNDGCRSQFWERKRGEYYWDGDIQNMAKQVANYREDIQSGKAGAEDAFLSFKSARTAYVEDVVEHAQVCLDWLEDQEYLRRKQAVLRIKARRKAIFKRFEDLGYQWQDFKTLKSDVLDVNAELTEDGWHEARATLEPMIIFNRTKRLEREHGALLMRRKRVVAQVCTAFKITLPPLQWPMFPPLHELYQMEGFLLLINDPSSDELEPHRYAPVLEALPPFIAARSDDIRNTLLEKMPPNLVPATSASTNTLSDPLSLVTATFQCSWSGNSDSNRWILHSLSDVLAYLSDPSRFYLTFGHLRIVQDMLFSQAGHDAVVALLTLLGLDMRTTTPTALDKLDARFICMRCSANNGSGFRRRHTFNWRQCVQHYIASKGLAHHAMPEWMLLDANNTSLVKEKDSAHDRGDCWSCMHCPSHSEETLTRTMIVSHVQKRHNVLEPVEDVDFFNARPYMHQFRRPNVIVMKLKGYLS